MNLGYLTLEIRRALRAPGTLMFTVGFPAVFYVLETMLFKDAVGPGAAPVDYAVTTMVGMSAWGVMTAGLLTGTRVVNERVAGWQRQLRLTPLTGGGYLLGKAAVGMFVALPTSVVVPIVAVLVEGVVLTPTAWLHATVLLWLGSLPFAILGLVIGQWATKDSVQNFTIVGMMVLAMLGGLFMPLELLPAWWTSLSQLVPSYWLAEIGRAGILPGHNALLAFVILMGWAAVLSAAVVWRYRRDSART